VPRWGVLVKSFWKRTNNNSEQGTAGSAGSGFPLTPLIPLNPLNPLNPLTPPRCSLSYDFSY